METRITPNSAALSLSGNVPRIPTRVVKSIAKTDQEALLGVIQLHNSGKRFDLDCTYSTGDFYADDTVPPPRFRFDIAPHPGITAQADCRMLPLGDATIGPIVVDLPFLFGKHGKNRPGQAARGSSCPGSASAKYTQFASFEELSSVYQDALTECARVLRPKGRLIFKHQDLTDKYTCWVHIDVYQWALARGFRAIDHIIRIVERGRAWNPEKRQLHSRNFHSDFWVFERERKAR
jgi:hypothetical protein